ncbi:NAD(P)-dependent dehydrogenase, short-chain alcohol dehydrogenase family [Cognatiyoonia koreensis]|uniref:NAD(P)-dependent dehydrogenase, short-chain alcohol dehydrogenase family n=1 Tax=Cognatiyoonia koreensis TaxID=364200 RepID=A0A1I0PPM2_9RHOB|nr:glucose 1-dehydrogenase [Cognatiyoonia koreensis]SEW16336.1 NAD(P)-dependent dehydrogenase, short-chain alcohol dehydrogenase family [Cognatiyoonia koreensis]
MGQFDEQAVLITGAAAGIGRATALAFAGDGGNVMVSDIDIEGGEETANMIEQAGGKASFLAADVSNTDAVSKLISATVKTFGRLDCAVNNAGIEGKILPFKDQTKENFDNIIAVNLKGTFLCMQAEIDAMLNTGGGAIVNLSSVAGLIGFPGLSPYVASKHGVIGLTKNAALEYGTQGVRVNAVCPGGIDTRMLDSLASQATAGSQSSSEMMDPLHPIGRIGRVEEVADLILWLCSSKASFVTGAAVPVDGGFVAQ